MKEASFRAGQLPVSGPIRPEEVGRGPLCPILLPLVTSGAALYSCYSVLDGSAVGQVRMEKGSTMLIYCLETMGLDIKDMGIEGF